MTDEAGVWAAWAQKMRDFAEGRNKYLSEKRALAELEAEQEKRKKDMDLLEHLTDPEIKKRLLKDGLDD